MLKHTVQQNNKGWISKCVGAKIFEMLSRLSNLYYEGETLTEKCSNEVTIMSKFQRPSPYRLGVRAF